MNDAKGVAVGSLVGVSAVLLSASLMFGSGKAYVARTIDSGKSTGDVTVALQTATLTGLREATMDDSVLLIDARSIASHSYATLPRSINFPVNATATSMKQFLAKTPRTVPVMVYCQSRTCPYDDIVGEKLVRMGFQSVSVCEEGYHEFRQRFDTADDGS